MYPKKEYDMAIEELNKLKSIQEKLIKRVINLECSLSYEHGYPCENLEELIEHRELSEESNIILTELGLIKWNQQTQT